eukprot:jgi/Tetstr1/454233/TSEL_041152.t1
MVPRVACRAPAPAPPPRAARPPPVRLDFGDGECVAVRLKHQPDFSHMLRSVGAAGVRRKAANGFPTIDAPLLRDIAALNHEHQYIVWPRPPEPRDGGGRL